MSKTCDKEMVSYARREKEGIVVYSRSIVMSLQEVLLDQARRTHSARHQ